MNPSSLRAGALLGAFLVCACAGEDPPGDGAASDDPAPATPSADREVAVAVSFGSPVPDSAVVGFLQDHGLRPYGVFMTAAGTTSALRAERSRATMELVARARSRAATDLRTALCAQQGQAAALRGSASPDELRAFLSRVRALGEALPGIARGEPLVYGVLAVGTPTEAGGARRDGRAFVSAPAGDGADPSDPRAPAGATDPGIAPEIAALPDARLREMTRVLASNGLEDCHDVAPGRGRD